MYCRRGPVIDSGTADGMMQKPWVRRISLACTGDVDDHDDLAVPLGKLAVVAVNVLSVQLREVLVFGHLRLRTDVPHADRISLLVTRARTFFSQCSERTHEQSSFLLFLCFQTGGVPACRRVPGTISILECEQDGQTPRWCKRADARAHTCHEAWSCGPQTANRS